jgi:hypothetical protein
MDLEGIDNCDPLGQADMSMTLLDNVYALVLLYIGCSAVSLFIMLALSNKYE